MGGDNMKISDAFKRMEKKYRLKFFSLGMPEDGAERAFSSRGCDICDNGLGNDVWTLDAVGVIPGPSKTCYILHDLDVCHECLCYSANGEDEE